MGSTRITLFCIMAVAILFSSCQRGCPRKPPAAAKAVADKRLEHIAPWIDPSSDVVMIIDLAAASNNAVMEPWLAWLMHGQFGRIIQGTSFQIKHQIGLVTFQMHINSDKTFRRMVLIQTAAAAGELASESAAKAAAEGLQIKVLDRFILAIGNTESLAQLSTQERAGPDAGLPEFHEVGAAAWGRVDTTRAVKGMLPALWDDVKNISFSINTGMRLAVSARLNFESVVRAKIFQTTLDGLISMGTLLKDDAPWLTSILRSTIVRLDQSSVVLEVTIPQEVVMQLPVAGCHLVPHLHLHVADLLALAFVAGVGLAIIFVLRRRNRNI